jgi:predicted helicase
MIQSVEDTLNSEFNLSLNDKGVHILDPFTGTGTFIVRLLQSKIIKNKNLLYKYLNEIHANEIVLLAYYIAAINIEECFHDINQIEEYQVFEGATLTDTFQLLENKKEIEEQMFPENNERVKKQNDAKIKVIIGNPPYSLRQKNENDSNQNLNYQNLDSRIKETYQKLSSAKLSAPLYDSYVRAFRWASDRIDDNGIICFVTNGSFIDSMSTDGLRKSIQEEFSKIYIFNLRGNQRTAGELSRKEGGKIFGSGSRTPVVISIFIKNTNSKNKNKIFYHDIGDYLSREDKLKKIKKFKTITNVQWNKIIPNEQGDWINKRSPIFKKFIQLIDKESHNDNVLFNFYSLGVTTARDVWVVNFSKKILTKNIKSMIDFYNTQVQQYSKFIKSQTKKSIESKNLLEEFINTDSKKISWTRGLKKSISKGIQYKYEEESLVKYLYRPFCMSWIYFNKNFNEMPSQISKIFPKSNLHNIFICFPGPGSNRDFSSFISKNIIDYNFFSGGTQCFPLYTYEDINQRNESLSLFNHNEESENIGKYNKKININDAVFKNFKSVLKYNLSKEDIFYYVYGILNSRHYKNSFNSELKKELPRIPLSSNFKIFSNEGKKLAQLHLDYEKITPYSLKENNTGKIDNYRVKKIKFGKNSNGIDKSVIIYNEDIILEGIPLEAYNYIINGKSAIEWVMERYQIQIDKDSDIKNDPNDYCAENKDPKYILNLLKKVINLSVQSVKIINSLPEIDEINS